MQVVALGQDLHLDPNHHVSSLPVDLHLNGMKGEGGGGNVVGAAAADHRARTLGRVTGSFLRPHRLSAAIGIHLLVPLVPRWPMMKLFSSVKQPTYRRLALKMSMKVNNHFQILGTEYQCRSAFASGSGKCLIV